MKSHLLTRKYSCAGVCRLTVFALAISAFIQARAEDATGPAPALAPSDVSQFPGKDHLPGKVPPTVWTGLARVWARDHAQWKTSASNDVGAVVFLGDSITEGWHTLGTDFSNLKVANRGIGGDITSGVLYRLQADVLDLRPAAIILLIGTNDVGDNEDPADVADNIKAILAAINKYNPNIKVIVCKTMPRADGNPASYAERIQKLNGLVADYVATQPNVAVCDTYSIFVDAQGNQITSDFNSDHLHLNAAGYAVWKKALDPVMAKLSITTESAK
jgi:lysophospholipase L1-like esterase